MKNTVPGVIVFTMFAGFALHGQQAPAKKPDTSPHTVQFVTVDKDVKLEVLDWGGTGRPLVFLAGSGFDAHVFDEFAPKFTGMHHVYGITRRGYGVSDKPVPANNNYSTDRRGDDVLEVMEALKIERPVLAGHSLAGGELSSIGTRHPERVSGLIYLDAGYSYAYYTPSIGDASIDAMELKRLLDKIVARGVEDPEELKELHEDSEQLSRDLQDGEEMQALLPPQPRPAHRTPVNPIALAIGEEAQKYTAPIQTPILAIFADPHDHSGLYKNDPLKKAAVLEYDKRNTDRCVEAFKAGQPSARVIEIPNANHFVFRSNEAEVMREMNAFLAKLP